MTGNASRRGLFGFFSRHGHASWRGRYRFSHLFLNFYFLVMGAFIAIVFAVDVLISIAVKGFADDYMRRFMRGTIFLIEEDLSRRPRSRWPQAIKELDKKFAYNLDIVDRWSLNLPTDQAERLDSGNLAVAVDGETLYHRLKQTSSILVVGPLSASRPDARWPRGIMSPELRVRLMTLALISVFLAIAVWFWIRPIGRDLEALRQTARNLGEGHLESRAPEALSSTFALLTETINGMAERIQHLIATRKALSSSISHELRTPIARMRFALEMIPEADEAERKRLLRMLDTDVEELDNLVDSSLVYARYERRQFESNLSPVRIVPWIEEKTNAVRILGHTLSLTVNTRGLPEDQEADIDPWSMSYALTNLLRNAIKYATSRIIVSAEVADGLIRVHVDDDGIGIPPGDRTQIFHPFTRLDRSRDRATGGHGLGLAIVRQVLRMHRGSASASDSPVLDGARFTLEWPIRSAAEKNPGGAAKPVL
ncbi:MAG: HAMP domain-containing protein [Candidatus Accumulibacter sp.]|jgi:two-component system sensor histidine kinase RstB|nr:HAMP domain-containing protein [Accumulibacter sp.]